LEVIYLSTNQEKKMQDHIGILGTGIYLPETKITATEIAMATEGKWTEEAVIEKLGLKEKNRCRPKGWYPGNGCKSCFECFKKYRH
jgi:hypothetical protein